MTKPRKTFAAVVVTAVLVTLGAAAPPAAAQPPGSNPEMEKMMEEMQKRTREATVTGEHHEALARFVGDWDVAVALVMPGAPRQEWKARSNYHWLIEGRWLGQRITGDVMGGPYESYSILGFDSYAKNHVVATVSSLDTSLNFARGLVVDPEGRETAVYGTLDEYTTGELHKPFKVVTRILDDDHHVVEIWDMAIGTGGATVLEFSYARRKGGR